MADETIEEMLEKAARVKSGTVTDSTALDNLDSATPIRLLKGRKEWKERTDNPRQYEPAIHRREIEHETRIRIVTDQGPAHHPFYAQLINFVAMSPTKLLLLSPFCTYTVTCQNIDMEELEAALHDALVYCLQPFNPKRFDQPEEGTPLITSITARWGRPEPQSMGKDVQVAEVA